MSRASERNASTGKRVLSAVRAQLREVASQALEGAIDQLEAHVHERRPARSRTSRSQSERMREVLERDRALSSAARAAAPLPTLPTPAAPAAVARAPEPPAIACDEPIRTRTMAKLLAAHGHRERALSIYDYLIGKGECDPALQAEAAALRANAHEGAAS